MYNREKHIAARALSLKEFYKNEGYKIFSPFPDRMDFIATSPTEPVTGMYTKNLVRISNHVIKETICIGWR